MFFITENVPETRLADPRGKSVPTSVIALHHSTTFGLCVGLIEFLRQQVCLLYGMNSMNII